MKFTDKTTYIQRPAEQINDSSNIPSSKDIAGVEVRMLPPFIKNNKTARFWPFPGYAHLYCLTIVISDTANQLTGYMDLNTFPSIGDGEYLPINKTIYYWESKANLVAPGQVHVLCSVIKSKEALRDTASILEAAKSDSEYKDVIEQLGSIVSETASFSVIANMSLQIANIVGKYLGKINDKPIGTTVNSFTRLHGDWDRLGIIPMSIETKNVDFNFEVIVRDQNRHSSNRLQTMAFSNMVPF